MATTDLRTDALGNLERLGYTVARPPRKRDARGRWQRADAGEYDWFYLLSDSTQAYVRRRHMSGDASAVGPDVLARLAGFDYVEDWARAWVEAVRLSRANPSCAEDWDRADWYPGVVPPDPSLLLGPCEVADLLGVERNTVDVWSHRGILPEPWAVISGTKLWPRHEIVAWAQRTGRLPAEAEAEQLESF